MSIALRQLRRVFLTSRPVAAVSRPKSAQMDHTLTTEEKLKRMVQNMKDQAKAKNPKSFRRYCRFYENAVQKLAAGNHFSLIEDLLEDQKQYIHASPEGFAASLITLYGRAGMFDHARKVFDEMPDLNCKRTVKSLNALLDACIESKLFEKIDEISNDLPRQLSIDVDLVTYNTIIKAYCRMGSIDTALSILDEIIEKGFEPNIVTFNSLLLALYGSGRIIEAEKMWVLIEGKKNASPNALSYYIKLRAMASQYNLADAVELFSDMTTRRNVEPNVSCFNVMIIGFCSLGDVEAAKIWYQKLILDSKCSPSLATYRTLIPFFLEKGELEMSQRLCIAAIDNQIRIGSTLVESVVNRLVSESKMELANELLGLCSDPDIGNHLQLP